VLQPEALPAANRNAVQTWRDVVSDCLRQPGSLRPWERDFLRSLSAFTSIDRLPAVLEILDEFERRLTSEILRAVGGDRFPPRRLRSVPR
jgi:hypothetical protein